MLPCAADHGRKRRAYDYVSSDAEREELSCVRPRIIGAGIAREIAGHRGQVADVAMTTRRAQGSQLGWWWVL